MDVVRIKNIVRIMLPDAKPMITSCFLFSFVWQWTDSFYSGMFLPNYSILANKVARLSEVLNSYVKATTGLDKASTAYASAMIGTGTLLVIIPLLLYIYLHRRLRRKFESVWYQDVTKIICPIWHLPVLAGAVGQ